MKLRRMFSQRTHLIHPIGPYTHLLLCLVVFGCVLDHFVVVFGCVWDHFVTAVNSMQNGLNWCNYFKSSCHEKSCPNLSQRMQPIHPHWTLNSCFVLFRSVWEHLGPFRCFMILGSKQDELLQLMQKFKPQSCIRIFCNKSAQSTPFDPILMFWFVS